MNCDNKCKIKIDKYKIHPKVSMVTKSCNWFTTIVLKVINSQEMNCFLVFPT